MIRNLLDLIFPKKCVFCRSIINLNSIGSKNYLCEECLEKLCFIPEHLSSVKNRDSVDLEYKYLEYSLDNKFYYKKNYYFDDCISVFYYKSLISKSICDFKFYNKSFYCKFFCNYMLVNINRFYNNIKFDYITYIPMYISKERQRGYNQSKLLANDLSKMLNIPIENLLIKTKDNKPQHSLTLKLRETNIKDVYKFSGTRNIKQKTILLIDDIITSGHTLNEASKILKFAGAKCVLGATIASTQKNTKNYLPA